jgi:hypothetical protein
MVVTALIASRWSGVIYPGVFGAAALLRGNSDRAFG